MESAATDQLLLAIEHGDVDSVLKYIETYGLKRVSGYRREEEFQYGDGTCNDKFAPIHIATEASQQAVVELLIHHDKSCVNAETDFRKCTPLSICCLNGDWQLYSFLLSQGGKTIHSDEFDRSLLHCAAQGGDIQICEDLVSKGLSVSSTDREGRTPFHLASQNGNVDILKILYNRKPDVAMAKDRIGRSALHYALQDKVELKETSVVKYLVCDLELEVDGCDERGITPFHLASKSGNVDILKILYNRKPDVAMAKDKLTGRSALHYACQYRGKDTAALKYLVCDLELEVDDCDEVRL